MTLWGFSTADPDWRPTRVSDETLEQVRRAVVRWEIIREAQDIGGLYRFREHGTLVGPGGSPSDVE